VAVSARLMATIKSRGATYCGVSASLTLNCETEDHATKLRLYICGDTAASVRAIQNSRTLLALIEGVHDFEIIDVLQDPEAAEMARVLATPTLIREEPLPIRVLVGDLSNHPVVLSSLNQPNDIYKDTP